MSIGAWYCRNGNWYNTQRVGVIKGVENEKYEVYNSRIDFINNAAASTEESLEEARALILDNPL